MSSGEIFVVDDDPAVREAFSYCFSKAGYSVTSFPDGDSFVAVARNQIPDCVLLDVFMPGRSGLDVLRTIDARSYAAPIFVASARGDIPLAVEAIRNGAADFIEKRADANQIVARIKAAIDVRRESRNGGSADLRGRAFPGSEALTAREYDVLARIIAGSSSQAAAEELGISRRTVEVHRARILAKLHARNTADLVRIVLSA